MVLGVPIIKHFRVGYTDIQRKYWKMLPGDKQRPRVCLIQKYASVLDFFEMA